MINNNELYHYGVLGMKWGVRRTPEQLGHHVIPKGTKMYRVTVNDKESTNGSKYVTYLKVDRDHYRGSYADGIRSNSGKNLSDNLYEKTYKLKENLHVPSRVELEQVHHKVMSDPKTREKIFKAYFDVDVQNDIDLWEDPTLTEKDFTRIGKERARESLKKYSSMKSSEVFDIASKVLGTQPKYKEAIIAELRKQGYNAMVDEASVGGRNGYTPEGVEPLIIFDGAESLSEKSTKKVTNNVQSKATKRYDKWLDVSYKNWKRDQRNSIEW